MGENRKFKEGNENHPTYHHKEITAGVNIVLNFLLFASKFLLCVKQDRDNTLLVV